jgi:hypothetical protein
MAPSTTPPSAANLQVLQDQVNALLAEVALLKAQTSTSFGSSTAGGTIAPTTPSVTFADTPQTLNLDTLLDYSTKSGMGIYNQGCKALDNKALADGFGMTPDQTIVFIKASSCRAILMGWTQGTQQITNFTSRSGHPINLIKCYGQIKEASLKMECEAFCSAGGTNAQLRVRQNNTMIANCLSASLTADAAARLLTYCKEYTFNSIEYVPLMYKIIMRLATIDNAATTQTLRDNLNNMGTYAATVNGDINKIHGEFDKNLS